MGVEKHCMGNYCTCSFDGFFCYKELCLQDLVHFVNGRDMQGVCMTWSLKTIWLAEWWMLDFIHMVVGNMGRVKIHSENSREVFITVLLASIIHSSFTTDQLKGVEFSVDTSETIISDITNKPIIYGIFRNQSYLDNFASIIHHNHSHLRWVWIDQTINNWRYLQQPLYIVENEKLVTCKPI